MHRVTTEGVVPSPMEKAMGREPPGSALEVSSKTEVFMGVRVGVEHSRQSSGQELTPEGLGGRLYWGVELDPEGRGSESDHSEASLCLSQLQGTIPSSLCEC